VTLVRQPSTDTATLQSLAEDRWKRLLAEQPDLSPAIELQRTFVRTQLGALASIQARGMPPFPEPDRVAANVEGGRPALSLAHHPPPDFLGPLVWAFARDMADAGAGDAAQHLSEALGARRLDGLSIVAASLARDACAFRAAADQIGVAPDLLWLTGELAAAPYAHACADRLAGVDHSRLSTALDTWRHGYCPVCGSWPAIAEGGPHDLTLRCSFCATGWSVPRRACIYCGWDEELEMADSGQAGRTWVACGRCEAYTKVVATESSLIFPLQAVEDLATAGLDRAAMARGLHRPSLTDLSHLQRFEALP
jgi:FdhE protein